MSLVPYTPHPWMLPSGKMIKNWENEKSISLSSMVISFAVKLTEIVRLMRRISFCFIDRVLVIVLSSHVRAVRRHKQQRKPRKSAVGGT